MTMMQLPEAWHAKEAEDLTNLRSWLQDHAKALNLEFLLAHADDGVIWGKFENHQLITADSGTPLRLSTLQQCRIFGKTAEVMLWKANGIWKYRSIADDSAVLFIPEVQILWGTKVERSHKGFTIVTEGSQGFQHAIPLSLTEAAFTNDNHPLRLEVRHYISYDEDGAARIECSRLVNVFAEPKK
jgi:CRISPR-associated protein (TIGR03984 family)